MNWKVLLAALTVASFLCRGAVEERPFGVSQRVPWTTSRLTGSPEPPLPYTVEKIFGKIKWGQAIFVAAEPGSDRLFVVEQGGETSRPSRILELPDDPNMDHADTLLAVSNHLVYSLTFHPGYRTNGYIYLFTNGPVPETNRMNRICRYTVARQPPFRCDPKSEHPILEWRSIGHDGGGLIFGHDGMLYISSGDGSTDSDEWVTGQDLSDLNGGILRIDVDHPDGAHPYSVPKDNPFVGMKDVRPENWAYGLRNPWRMAIDEKNGRIWVGNNGQDLWETAHLVHRGENYGWSVYEGSHPFYLNRKLGPTPVVAPTIEHGHLEARSLTGGVVYYGKEISDLDGLYVYGDFSTGKIWATGHDGEHVISQRELANTELQITAFAVDQRGDLLITDYAGGIYRLIRAQKQTSRTEFPKRLSETGIFLSTKDHTVQPGVIPYSVNAPAWMDGASAQRFIALPGDMRLDYSSAPTWTATNGAVLVQTLSLEIEPGNATSRRRIETRVLLRDTGQWHGYSYRWDERESDATLVAVKGEEKEFAIKDSRAPGGLRKQTWRFPARAECSVCHSRAAGFVLGLTELQLNKTHDYAGSRDNQLRTLHHIGIFTNYPGDAPGSRPEVTQPVEDPPSPSPVNSAGTNPAKGLAKLTKLTDPYDPSKNLESRARSYLHVNCAVCHVFSGGGNSKMELGFATRRGEMNLIGARPQHATFGIADAMLVAPGDPDRSILIQRLSHRGPGQMPPLVINRVDEPGVSLFRTWIASMKPEQNFVRAWIVEDLLPLLEETKRGRSFSSGQAAFKQVGCGECHKFAGEGGSVGPDLTGVARGRSTHDLLESIILPSKVIAEGYAATEIETKSGMQANGRVVREDEQTLILLPQAANAEPIRFPKADIRRRELSKLSNMPSGTVNSLQTNQILDLVAYLISDGNSNHLAFLDHPKALNKKESR